jgi:hypothetical protein
MKRIRGQCEWIDFQYKCKERGVKKAGDRVYCRKHASVVENNRAAVAWGLNLTPLILLLLMFFAWPVSAQTVTSVTENVAIVGTGFAAGDTFTASPSGTLCTNVVIASATSATATCPDGTVTVTVAPPAPPPCTLVPANVWTNLTFPTQTANFEIVFTVTPSAAKFDGLVALSAAKASTDNGTSVPTLFGETGYVQMLNGAFPYPASTAAPYVAAGTYTETLDVNITAQNYNGYVNGTLVASNYAFRSAAGKVSSLGFLSVFQDSGSGTLNICNITINPYPPPPVAHSVALAWKPGTGDVNFVVQRAATSAGPFTQIASVTTPAYTDTNVVSGNSYSYQVLGASGSVISLPSNMVNVTIPGGTTNAKPSFLSRLFRKMLG